MTQATDMNSRPRGSVELAETSILDAIVPLESNLDIEAALSSVERPDDAHESPLAGISQRSALYFGNIPHLQH